MVCLICCDAIHLLFIFCFSWFFNFMFFFPLCLFVKGVERCCYYQTPTSIISKFNFWILNWLLVFFVLFCGWFILIWLRIGVAIWSLVWPHCYLDWEGNIHIYMSTWYIFINWNLFAFFQVEFLFLKLIRLILEKWNLCIMTKCKNVRNLFVCGVMTLHRMHQLQISVSCNQPFITL